MRRGPILALTAAVLFGASTPLAKLLLGAIDPLLLAALLYLGSGMGLFVWRRVAPPNEAGLTRTDAPWLAAAILAGGVVAPAMLMFGLARTPATTASLLLNLEGVFTALIAWLAFHENIGRRIAAGMSLITIGAVALSWTGGARFTTGAMLIVLACLGWAIDNNLTRRVSAADATQIAMVKGFAAAFVNGSVALVHGTAIPHTAAIAGATLLGFASYGISLTLFVQALRLLGTARTSAYFSTAPFAGALLSLLLLREGPASQLALAGVMMVAGVWLHLAERHKHSHPHQAMRHIHSHVHDEHHQHAHASDDPRVEPHTHEHIHEPLTHSHPHYPDIHHRHEH